MCNTKAHVTFTGAIEVFHVPPGTPRPIKEPPFTCLEDGEPVEAFEYRGVVYTWNGEEYAPEEGAKDGQRSEGTG